MEQTGLSKMFAFQGNVVRVVGTEEKPMFVAKDVAECLGYARPRDAIATHCKGGREMRLPTAGGEQAATIIPESDVYSHDTHCAGDPMTSRLLSWQEQHHGHKTPPRARDEKKEAASRR
jgi:hypothetical protein